MSETQAWLTRSVEETMALGEQLGQAATRGLVIGLSGDLGAGKTQLVRGIARGLGSTARVHSPTFALLHEYPGGRLPLFHLDLYRLDTREQVHAAGLDEYLPSPTGVTVVEWIERWVGDPMGATKSGARVPNFTWYRIEMLDETTRRIVGEYPGA